jgi:antagonist of KipI
MLTTIQDLGRWGRQASGVPVAGPMDPYSHRLANRLVGNHASAAALEVTLIGPELEADADVMCAVAGAMFDLTMDGQSVPVHAPFTLGAGRRLRFGSRTAGVRATLAVRGGLDVDRVFGSRAASPISRMGPLGGRARRGDVLPLGDAPATAALPSHRWNLTRDSHCLYPTAARARIVPGPHDHRFTSQAYDTLFGSRYIVTPSSNRMGYRLDGAPLVHAASADILSDATPLGSIQVPASGQPILLMADRQTTGGYPKIGTLATADLPVAGQLGPGDWIEFAPCTREVAIAALKVRYARLEALGR